MHSEKCRFGEKSQMRSELSAQKGEPSHTEIRVDLKRKRKRKIKKENTSPLLKVAIHTSANSTPLSKAFWTRPMAVSWDKAFRLYFALE